MGALFGFTGTPETSLCERMERVLTHRGTRAAAFAEQAGGTIGYRGRGEASEQALLGAGLHVEGDCAVALAGRLTNAPELAPVLPTLLAQYRARGPAFVEDLRGGFVLALLDGKTLHLARDGAGQRTLYYGRQNGRFFFAIEPKGVLAAPGFPRRLRPGAVAQYLTFSFVPGGQTMLEDLRELLPGHRLTVRPDGTEELVRTFAFEIADKEEAPEAVWVDRFRQTFGQAVADRLPRDERIGLYLSGGIDSSVVAAEVARRAEKPVSTYAIHFGADHPHELDFARAVAERCKTDHHEVLIRPRDFLPRLRQMIWHLDEPIGDPITMPNFELSRQVSSEVRHVYNGEGGDPLFGGPKNIPMMLQHWYGGIERGPRFRERAYLASYRRAYDILPALLTPAWQRRFDPQVELEGVLTPFFSCDRPAHLLDKLMAINIRLKGAHLILPKVERMTGAWGVTPLAPLFDERLLRLSFQMPTTLKLRSGVEKVVLKQAYAGALPREVIERPKSGMRVPVHFWFQGELKRYARKILRPGPIRRAGIFDPERVRQLLRYDLEGGAGRYGLRLWMLLTFEIWRRIVLEGEAV